MRYKKYQIRSFLSLIIYTSLGLTLKVTHPAQTTSYVDGVSKVELAPAQRAGEIQQINPLSLVICLMGQAESWEGR